MKAAVRWRAAMLCGAFAAALAAAPAGAQPRPALVSLGTGFFDSSRNQPRDRAVDLRAEYRFSGWDLTGHEALSFRPWAGVEATTDGMAYALGGISLDLAVGPLHLAPSIGAGLHHDGGGKQMGSAVEFRSTVELGWAFGDGSRISIGYGHISNAGITEDNPGVEIISLYYHLPVDW